MQNNPNSFEQIMDDINQKIKKMFQGNSNQNSDGNSLQWVFIAILLVAYGLFTAFYKIDSSQQGVVTRFGAFSHIAEEGPHFMLPFGIDEVYKIEVTRIHELEFGFRSAGQLPEQQARLESLMLTGDLNVAEVQWILQYRIDDAKKYLFNAADKVQTIQDISISAMRRVVGDKLVSDVLTTDRVLIAEKARQITQEVLNRFDIGVIITKVALQNVTPPVSVRPAFNEVNIAKQESERMINQAKGTYNKIIPEAEGKAEKIITEAEAYAINLTNRAKGDAQKYKEVLIAYKKSPEITRKRLYLEALKEVFSASDKLVIVDPGLKGVLPVFQQRVDDAKILSAVEEEARQQKESEGNKKSNSFSQGNP